MGNPVRPFGSYVNAVVPQDPAGGGDGLAAVDVVDERTLVDALEDSAKNGTAPPSPRAPWHDLHIAA
jgi:hypothetical protein